MIHNNSPLGLVTKKFNEFFYVDLIEDMKIIQHSRLLCKCRKSVHFQDQSIFVGDKVILTEINMESKTGVIEKLIKRNNLLERPSVANISDIYVTFSVDEPAINFSQVSNFLLNAENIQIKVELLLTKCDLISEKKLNFLIKKFHNWGYEVTTLNIKKSNGFNDFIKELKTKKCSILMGPSGVGKTTILNKIIPDIDNQTGSVSKKIRRGKNTTRNVELFELSVDSYIVDTPGFNLPEVQINYSFIPYLFPEINRQLRDNKLKCKFRDCFHISEPGCNVNKNFERYEFYKLLMEKSMNLYRQNQGD